MIKHIINTFVAIAACLGVAAFVMVLVKKQNCQTKEPLTTSSCGKLDDKSKSKNIEKYNNSDSNSNIVVNQVPVPSPSHSSDYDNPKETYTTCKKATDCGENDNKNTYECEPICAKDWGSWPFNCPQTCVHNGEPV